MNDLCVPTASSVKFLEVAHNSKLTWDIHMRNTVKKARLRFYVLNVPKTPIYLKLLLYMTDIRPIWQYGFAIWNSASNTHLHKIQTLQNRILRMVIDAPWYVRNTTIHKDSKMPSVSEILHIKYSRHHSTLMRHPNPLISRRLKRKRHMGSLTQH